MDPKVDLDILALANKQGEYVLAQPTTQPRKYSRQKRTRNLWLEFVALTGSHRDVDNPYDPRPSTNQAVAFLTWLARTLKGVKAERISIRTLRKYWDILNADIKGQTGTGFCKDDRNKIDLAIREELARKEGLSTSMKVKPLATSLVIEDIIEYLWKCDEHEYEHPRMRVQVALAILIFRYTGMRPGELVESSEYLGSNEGLLWKDIQFWKAMTPTGPTFGCYLTMRNRKGRRDRRDKDQDENLRENPDNRSLCPMTLLMALAVADGAIEQVDSAADLERVRFPQNGGKRTLYIREEMQNVPILRGYEGKTTSKDRILTTEALRTSLLEIGCRAGYEQEFSAYSIRRGYGNKLDKFLTPAERNRQMGHSNDNIFTAYMSRISAIDIQNIIDGKAPDQKLIDYLRSMECDKDSAAPLPPRSILEEARFRRRERPTETTQQEYRSKRDEYFEHRKDIYAGTRTTAAVGKLSERPPQSSTFWTYLQYDGQRRQAMRVLFGESISKPTESFAEIVGIVVGVANPTEWYYPGATPINGQCWCGKQMEEFRDKFFFKYHLLGCYRKDQHASTTCTPRFQEQDSPLARLQIDPICIDPELLEPTDSRSACRRFCFRCLQHFDSISDWEAHCEMHLGSLDMFCGRVFRRGILLRPALCPLCLGKKTLSASERYRQFAFHKYIHHVEHHLSEESIKYPTRCPHPICSSTITSNKDFWDHMVDKHGISIAQPKKAGFLRTRLKSVFDNDTRAFPKKLQELSSDLSEPNSTEDSPVDLQLEGVQRDSGSQFCCTSDGCRLSYADLESFLVHASIHSYKRCPVADCLHGFRNLPGLRDHLFYQHSLSTYVCNLPSIVDSGAQCDKIFRELAGLKNHQKTHRRKAALRCPYGCKHPFRNEVTRDRHVAINHNGILPFRCTELTPDGVCDKGFRFAWILRRHIKEIHNSRTVPTMISEANHGMDKENTIDLDPITSDQNDPNRDEDDSELPIPEQVPKMVAVCIWNDGSGSCGFSAGQTDELKLHVFSHVKTKTRNCNFGPCQKPFHDRKALKRHICAVHLGILPYSCKICPYSASVSSRLRRHYKAHKGVEP